MLLSTIQPLSAQRYKEKYPEGYIVSHRGDTTYGFIRLGNHFKDQKRIRFYDQFGVKAKYSADRLKGFGYDGKYYESRKTPYLYSGLFSDSLMFMLRTVEGPMRLYRFYTRQSVFTLKKGAAFIEYLERPEGQEFEISLVYRWKRISAAFTDYPELASDINNERYKPSDMEKIVQAYNRWYRLHGKARDR